MNNRIFAALREGMTIRINNPLVNGSTKEVTPLQFSTKMDGGELTVTSNPDYKAGNGEEVVIVPRGAEYKIPEILVRRVQHELYTQSVRSYRKHWEN